MSRNHGVGRLLGLILLGALGGAHQTAFAQDTSTAPADGANSSQERVDRSRLVRPDLRAPAVDPNTGKPVDPRIDALLTEWSERTKEIKRLQGRHFRATRDFQWGSESWAEGQFYVEMPDKGRIDVKPYSKDLPDPKKVRPRRNPAGRFVQLNIVRDSKHDRWICDGNEIKVINDDDKTYEAVKIPPSQRGENIMDGPLPFLFGMPPDKAKARYRFTLLAEPTDDAYAIRVRPNWKQDAVDWAQAELLLDRKTCLPREVHLHNAAGTSETVYIFTELQVNRIRLFFWSDPFKPNLAFFKRSVHNTPSATQNPEPIAANKMPWLIGSPYKPVTKKLKSLGLTVKLMRGHPATAPEQEFHVESQDPPPGTPLDRTSPVVLTLYVRMDPNQQPPQNAAAPQPSSRSDYRSDPSSRTVAKPQDP